MKRATDNTSKRRGIQGAGRALRSELAKTGAPITQEAAERRVRGAVRLGEKKREG